tara:strand:+ start:102 stop:350 length:249 start_codon:yes stop_codon:yes gene_type:complete
MKIKYFAWLKEITKTDYDIVNHKSITDIQTLIKFIKKKHPKLNLYFNKKNIIRIAVNLEYTSSNKKLSHDDEIAFFPPVSGG